MGTAVSLVGTDVVVRLSGLDAVFALRREIRVPRALVESVEVQLRQQVPHRGMRLPGTSFPGLIRAGSYGTGATRDFWNVRRGDRVLVLQIASGAPYRRVVLELPDPEAAAALLS